MEIKPIETHYDGYHFRSRLEARWAVFFNYLEISYQYEIEGYQTSAGWYLPDFWIPEWECYVEVKGSDPTNEEWNKYYALHKSGKSVLLIVGQPWPREHTCQWADDPTGYDSNRYPDQFVRCRNCRKLAILRNEFMLEFTLLGHHEYCIAEGENNALKPSGRLSIAFQYFDGACGGIIRDAYSAARQARFEHGQTPGV